MICFLSRDVALSKGSDPPGACEIRWGSYSELLAGPISKQELLRLAGDGKGQRFGKQHVARHLIVSDLAAAKGLDIFRGKRLSGPGQQACADLLPSFAR